MPWTLMFDGAQQWQLRFSDALVLEIFQFIFTDAFFLENIQ